MSYKKLQLRYDRIYSYFKSTTEPFDFIEWNGKILLVWEDGEIVEQYSSGQLEKLVLRYI